MIGHDTRVVLQAMLELADAGKRPRPIFYLDLIERLPELDLSPQDLNDAVDEIVSSGLAVCVLRKTNSGQEFITYLLKKGARGYLTPPSPPGPRLRLSPLAI